MLGPFPTNANYSRELFMRIIRASENNSREQFARTRIHIDASDKIARQNTLTSFLTFIIDSVYRFIVFTDVATAMSQIRRTQRKFVHNINKPTRKLK